MAINRAVYTVFKANSQDVTSCKCSLPQGDVMILELSQKRYFTTRLKFDLDQYREDHVINTNRKVKICA